jgi:DNA-binding CsgD family transcriptional regulator
MVCITCGTELHPERAEKYNYCTAPECQEKNFKGLTMVAIGMNKSGEELLILDEQTQADMASGKYRDQRRTLFGTAAPAAPADGVPAPATASPQAPVRKRPTARPRPAPARPQWTPRQERLAKLYNEQGLRPDEIAAKLGISRHLATQIVLAARNRGRS